MDGAGVEPASLLLPEAWQMIAGCVTVRKDAANASQRDGIGTVMSNLILSDDRRESNPHRGQPTEPLHYFV